MLFNSLAFAVFLPIVFALYWLIPHKYRWILLFVASYYFYMSWNAKYVFLILFTTLISYFAAILLEKYDNPGKRKMIVGITAVSSLGVLFYFKYFNFLSQAFIDFIGMFSVKLNSITIDVLLPVGISFYTFQTLSYVIDVYRGNVKAERHFGYYATFISFFPQLVAGPIERTNNLLPQIKNEHVFDYKQATYGLKLMAWGFFKKIAIADMLSKYVKMVFNNPQQYTGFSLLLTSFFFAIQIYCDFSGYSDIAIGASKLFGINLMTNFKSPYFAQSVKEFWSRWHISLSTWFKDYVYIPLGGNRVGKLRHYLNLMITFLTSGLWHGASWMFIIWGGIHGFLQILENAFIPKEKLRSSGFVGACRTLLLFCFCVFTWIFFVSKSMSDAMYVISHLFDGISMPEQYVRNGLAYICNDKRELRHIGWFLVVLFAYDYASLKRDVIEFISSKPLVVRWFVYILIIMIVLFAGAMENAEFVYFQF